MFTSVDSKLDRLRNELKADVEEKIKAVKQDLDIDIAQISKKYDTMSKEIEELRQKVDGIVINRSVEVAEGAVYSPDAGNRDPLQDVDRCVIATGIHWEEGEDIDAKVKRLLDSMQDIEIQHVACLRLKARGESRTPLTKIAFSSLQDKIKVLRAKSSLRNSSEFSRVFLRSSKSHTERLIEINFKKLMEVVPGAEGLRVAGNGRIVDRRSEDNEGEMHSSQTRSVNGWRYNGRGRRRGSFTSWSTPDARGNKRQRVATGSPIDAVPETHDNLNSS